MGAINTKSLNMIAKRRLRSSVTDKLFSDCLLSPVLLKKKIMLFPIHVSSAKTWIFNAYHLYLLNIKNKKQHNLKTNNKYAVHILNVSTDNDKITKYVYSCSILETKYMAVAQKGSKICPSVKKICMFTLILENIFLNF